MSEEKEKKVKITNEMLYEALVVLDQKLNFIYETMKKVAEAQAEQANEPKN